MKRGWDLEALIRGFSQARKGASSQELFGSKGIFPFPESLRQTDCKNGPNSPSFPHHLQCDLVVLLIKKLKLFPCSLNLGFLVSSSDQRNVGSNISAPN